MADNRVSTIFSVLGKYDLWGTLGWADIRSRYRRTVVGPFWLTLSTAAMVLSVGILYAGIFHKDTSFYIPYLATGLIIWNFLSTTVNESAIVFVGAAGIIKASTVDLPIHVLRMIWRNVIIFSHNILIIVVLWLIYRWNLSWQFWLVIPGLLLLMIAVYFVAILISILCTRFRDIPQIISAVLQLCFFITPIIWVPEDIGRASFVVTFNPLYNLLEIVRGPMLGKTPALSEWIVSTTAIGIAAVIGLAFYSRFRHRIAYWL